MVGGGFGYGVRRAVGEIIGGIVTSVLMDAVIGSGLVSSGVAVLFGILSMLEAIVLILAVPYWGTVYLIGWLFGLGILFQTGIVGILDAAVYFGVPLVVLVLRFWKMLTD
jgi:hypothetical protein